MAGGVGHSWFEVTLGEGGVGESWFTVELTSEPDPTDPTDPQPEPNVALGGDGDGFTFGGGPVDLRVPQQVSFPGVYRVPSRPRKPEPERLQPVALSFTGKHELHRTYTFSVSVSSSLIRGYQFSVGGTIGPAERWLSILRDDDEVIDII